jgi:hypothetical protein
MMRCRRLLETDRRRLNPQPLQRIIPFPKDRSEKVIPC